MEGSWEQHRLLEGECLNCREAGRHPIFESCSTLCKQYLLGSALTSNYNKEWSQGMSYLCFLMYWKSRW
jgi:hypothetical protein